MNPLRPMQSLVSRLLREECLRLAGNCQNYAGNPGEAPI